MPNRDVVAAHEGYPSPEEWGRYGWSFPVSMKPFVMDLAEKSLGIRKGFGSFVRKANSNAARLRPNRISFWPGLSKNARRIHGLAASRWRHGRGALHASGRGFTAPKVGFRALPPQS
jgi:hypothetical protein